MDSNWQKDNLLFTWNNNKYTYRYLKNITCKYLYLFLIEKPSKQAVSSLGTFTFKQMLTGLVLGFYQTTNLTGHMCSVEFNFKLLHNILPSGTLLHKWKLSNSSLCIVCNTPDYHEHMVIYCFYVKSFWSKVTLLMYKSLNIIFNVKYTHVVLGYNDSSNAVRYDRN